MRSSRSGLILAGALAGVVNGLFGAGGGMVLVPLLGALTRMKEEEIFPASICVIMPLCVVSLAVSSAAQGIPWDQALPYLAGGALGGSCAGIWGKKIPVKWLHRGLGILILWGGFRYLCPGN